MIEKVEINMKKQDLGGRDERNGYYSESVDLIKIEV